MPALSLKPNLKPAPSRRAATLAVGKVAIKRPASQVETKSQGKAPSSLVNAPAKAKKTTPNSGQKVAPATDCRGMRGPSA
ncbi:MAG: hypothetical protein RL514_1173 [Verrucomicrobiota bacterium]